MVPRSAGGPAGEAYADGPDGLPEFGDVCGGGVGHPCTDALGAVPSIRVDAEIGADGFREFGWQGGHRLDLLGVADDHRPPGTHDRADGGLGHGLPSLIDEEPAQRLGRQVAEHPGDRCEGGRDNGDHQEQRRPEVRHVGLGLGLPRVPSDQRLEKVFEVAAKGLGGRVDEGLMDGHGELEHAVALAVGLHVQPWCRLLDDVPIPGEERQERRRRCGRRNETAGAQPGPRRVAGGGGNLCASPAEALVVSACRMRCRAASTSLDARSVSRSAWSRASESCGRWSPSPWRRSSRTGGRGSPADAGHAPPSHGLRGSRAVSAAPAASVALRCARSAVAAATSASCWARAATSTSARKRGKRSDDLTGGLDVGEQRSDLLDLQLEGPTGFARHRERFGCGLRGGLSRSTTTGRRFRVVPAWPDRAPRTIAGCRRPRRGRRAAPCRGRSTSTPGRRSGSRRFQHGGDQAPCLGVAGDAFGHRLEVAQAGRIRGDRLEGREFAADVFRPPVVRGCDQHLEAAHAGIDTVDRNGRVADLRPVTGCLERLLGVVEGAHRLCAPHYERRTISRRRVVLPVPGGPLTGEKVDAFQV